MTDNERYQNYLEDNKFFFASNPDMEKWANDQVLIGQLKPLSDIVRLSETNKGWRFAFIPSDWTIEDLKIVFKISFLSEVLGLYNLAPDYQI